MNFLILGLLVVFNPVHAQLLDISTVMESESNNTISLGKQVMITSDVINNQDSSQSFAYISQIKDESGIVISLSWLTGSLSPNQSLSPAQSWTPMKSGAYSIEIFVWKSIDNPDALSPPLIMNIKVIEDQG